jgi:hypothetical protein
MRTEEKKHPTNITLQKENRVGHRESAQKRLDDILHGPPKTVPCSFYTTEKDILEENVFDFSMLSEKLPTIIWRSRWDRIAEQVGLPYRRGYMQNLDSEGAGPVKQILNNQIYYKSEDVIRWLNERQSKHRES